MMWRRMFGRGLYFPLVFVEDKQILFSLLLFKKKFVSVELAPKNNVPIL